MEIVDWFLIATALGFITLRDPQVMGVIRHLDGEVDALLRLPAVPVLHQVVARRHLHDDPVYVDVEGAVDVRLHAAGKGVDFGVELQMGDPLHGLLVRWGYRGGQLRSSLLRPSPGPGQSSACPPA